MNTRADKLAEVAASGVSYSSDAAFFGDPRFLELLEERGEELLSTCRTCKRISSYVSGIGKGRGAPSKLTRFLELSA